MAEGEKKGFLARFVKIKHVEWVILAVFLAVILLIFLGNFTENEGEEESADALLQYTEALEKRLAQTLSSVTGAGRVRVMVHLESGVEIVPAVKTETEGDRSVTTVLTVGGKPMILREIQPRIKGVIVVAEGAENATVKVNLLRAVATLTGVSVDAVQVFTMQPS